MANKLSWASAAEIIGVTPRTIRRWRARLERDGYSGLRDGRKGKPSYGQTVTIHQHLDGSVSIRYGPHVVGRWAQGRGKDGAVEAVESQTQVSHRSRRTLEIANGVSHFPTA